jgi:secondary thiamine-phosphate synthase enzyme
MVQTKQIALSTHGEGEVIDITASVAACVHDSGCKQGIVTVFAPGSTCAVTTIEYERGLLKDLEDLWQRLAPRWAHYQHDATWHDGNGFSHIRAAMIGPSLTVPIVDSNLALGTWQQVVFVDFDNGPRERELVVQIMGEG